MSAFLRFSPSSLFAFLSSIVFQNSEPFSQQIKLLVLSLLAGTALQCFPIKPSPPPGLFPKTSQSAVKKRANQQCPDSGTRGGENRRKPLCVILKGHLVHSRSGQDQILNLMNKTRKLRVPSRAPVKSILKVFCARKVLPFCACMCTCL